MPGRLSKLSQRVKTKLKKDLKMFVIKAGRGNVFLSDIESITLNTGSIIANVVFKSDIKRGSLSKVVSGINTMIKSKQASFKINGRNVSVTEIDEPFKVSNDKLNNYTKKNNKSLILIFILFFITLIMHFYYKI